MLPPGSRIHPVFHVSMLNKQVGEDQISSFVLPPISDDGDFILEPEAILDSRWVKRGSKIMEESLVKWKRLLAEDATWENSQDMQDRFMNLEDKVPLEGEGNDKPRRSLRVPRRNPKYVATMEYTC